ncbi:MAG: hypothetical protein KatS3mg008_1366 [Acidimicrobiales bacterium]|nr:MAG: hypothetical protein KatS3mg008_1366 [Acidimicrobiales bacterium]
MKRTVRSLALSVAVLVGSTACTPEQMSAWLKANGLPQPASRSQLEQLAEMATRFWKDVFDKLARASRQPQVPSWPWDALARCEAGGNWRANTGNGYYGGLQFLRSTWLAYGGGQFASYPHHATREQQIVVGMRVVQAHGGRYSAWPSCRRKLGLP